MGTLRAKIVPNKASQSDQKPPLCSSCSVPDGGVMILRRL